MLFFCVAMSQMSDIETRALAWGQEHYPDAPTSSHQAFASVVKFACNVGVSRLEVINTMRTSLAVTKIFQTKSPGRFAFHEAIELIKKDCYDPITLDHAKVWRQSEYKADCYKDVERAKELILTLQPTVIYNAERDQ